MGQRGNRSARRGHYARPWGIPGRDSRMMLEHRVFDLDVFSNHGKQKLSGCCLNRFLIKQALSTKFNGCCAARRHTKPFQYFWVTAPTHLSADQKHPPGAKKRKRAITMALLPRRFASQRDSLNQLQRGVFLCAICSERGCSEAVSRPCLAHQNQRLFCPFGVGKIDRPRYRKTGAGTPRNSERQID